MLFYRTVPESDQPSYLGFYNDELILFYDSSVFENGKSGLAICEDGIYLKDISGPPRYFDWKTFRKLELSHDEFNIYFGEDTSFFVFHRELKNLMGVLQLIKTGKKEEDLVNNSVNY